MTPEVGDIADGLVIRVPEDQGSLEGSMYRCVYTPLAMYAPCAACSTQASCTIKIAAEVEGISSEVVEAPIALPGR